MKNEPISIISLVFYTIFLFALISCKKDKDENKTLPTVVIVTITNITKSSAKITTKVTDEGGGTVTGTGICWAFRPILISQIMYRT